MNRKALFEEQLVKMGLPPKTKDMVMKLNDACFDERDDKNPCIDEYGFYKDPMACDMETLRKAWDAPIREAY